MNQFKQQLTTLLDKKMDRQDFLKHVAVGMVAISGVGTMLKLLSPSQNKGVNADLGYGSSAYGGAADNKRVG